jgi:hypothetical protein
VKKLLFIVFAFLSLASYAQDSIPLPKAKHWFDFKNRYYNWRLYAYWGYNRAFFSKSDIHFHGPGYDFTVYQVKANDRPEKFSFKTYFTPSTLTVPQYNMRLGFYFKHNIHVSIGMDHMKYVMKQDQVVRMSGVIDSSVSHEFAGSYVIHDQVLTKEFLRFEHTNGLNLFTVDFEYLLPIFHTRKDWLHIGWNFGLGGVFVVTKTEIHVIGIGIDNDFHTAGFCLPVKTGPRIDLWKYFFLAFEMKAGYAHLPWVLIRNNAVDLADHNFGFIEYYGVAGVSYSFGKGENPISKRKKAIRL